MSKAFVVVAMLAGAWACVIGGWGLSTASSMSTVELQEMGFWLSLAALSCGIGLVASGFARLFAGNTGRTT